MNRRINFALALFVMTAVYFGAAIPARADLANELISNPGFEGAWYWHDQNWNIITPSTDAAHSGATGAVATGSPVSSYYISVDTSKLYKLGFWAKTSVAGGGYAVQFDEFTNRSYAGNFLVDFFVCEGEVVTFKTDGQWHYYEVGFNIDNPYSTEVTVNFVSFTGTGTLYIDDVALATNHQIAGHVAFEDFTGKPVINHDISSVGVQIQFIQNSAVVCTEKKFLTADGNYFLDGIPAGVYDIAFKTPSSLRKIVPAVSISAAGSQAQLLGDATLTNGDLDGDNEITSSDLSIAIKNIDKIGD